MRDRPDAEALIAECRRVLQEELAPGLQGEGRFKALMIANALGMAGRELTAPAEQADGEAAARLVAALRRGEGHGSAETYAALKRDVEGRVAISNPKALKDG